MPNVHNFATKNVINISGFCLVFFGVCGCSVIYYFIIILRMHVCYESLSQSMQIRIAPLRISLY